MTPLVAIIMDVVLAILLIAAIVSCFVVYRKLKAIRDGQDEMKVVVAQLNKAVTNAQQSVLSLKTTAVEVEEQLQTQVKKAKSLTEELVMITEAGNNLADRIEKRLTSGSSGGGSGSQVGTSVTVEQSEKDIFSSRTGKERAEQKELLDALKEAR